MLAGSPADSGSSPPISEYDKDGKCKSELGSEIVNEIRALQPDVDRIIEHITVKGKAEGRLALIHVYISSQLVNIHIYITMKIRPWTVSTHKGHCSW